MTKEEISKVVMELVGNTHPRGDSSYDEKVYENLEKMIFVADDLMDEIEQVATNKESNLASARKVGQRADRYIQALVIDLKEGNK